MGYDYPSQWDYEYARQERYEFHLMQKLKSLSTKNLRNIYAEYFDCDEAEVASMSREQLLDELFNEFAETGKWVASIFLNWIF